MGLKPVSDVAGLGNHSPSQTLQLLQEPGLCFPCAANTTWHLAQVHSPVSIILKPKSLWKQKDFYNSFGYKNNHVKWRAIRLHLSHLAWIFMYFPDTGLWKCCLIRMVLPQTPLGCYIISGLRTPYCPSKIWNILNSETHVALRASDMWLWTWACFNKYVLNQYLNCSFLSTPRHCCRSSSQHLAPSCPRGAAHPPPPPPPPPRLHANRRQSVCRSAQVYYNQRERIRKWSPDHMREFHNAKPTLTITWRKK